jgi:hypothetical protein
LERLGAGSALKMDDLGSSSILEMGMKSGSSKFLHSPENPLGSTPAENEGEGERLGLAASQEERLSSSPTPRPNIVSWMLQIET